MHSQQWMTAHHVSLLRSMMLWFLSEKTWKTWRTFLDQTNSSVLQWSARTRHKLSSLPCHVSIKLGLRLHVFDEAKFAQTKRFWVVLKSVLIMSWSRLFSSVLKSLKINTDLISSDNVCLIDRLMTEWLYVVQRTAFRCWSNRMFMGPTSSIVRGRSLKSDLTTRVATTGSATTCSVSWHRAATTSWNLTCMQQTVPGTGPSTVRSLYSVRRPTTPCWYPGTRVTLVMRSMFKTPWCLPRTTVTTTRGRMTPIMTTVQWWTAADSGTVAAHVVPSTMFAVVEIASGGVRQRLKIYSYRCHACGSRARSLLWLRR